MKQRPDKVSPVLLVDTPEQIQFEFETAVQGNLDPVLLFAPDAHLKNQAARVLDSVGNRPGFIFNLGHGIHKETNPDKVATLVDYIHQHKVS